MIFDDNWKEYPELVPKIERIQSLAEIVTSDSQSGIGSNTTYLGADEIQISIPLTYDKKYFVSVKFALGYVPPKGIDEAPIASFHVSRIADMSFLMSCMGFKPQYNSEPDYGDNRHAFEFVVKNDPLRYLASQICSLLEEYGTAPSVYYASPISAARKLVNDARKEHSRKIESIYSALQENGEVSVKWKSEYQLYQLVRSQYPDAKYQFHPIWLEPQSLDIFIPSINMAIEYQGLQHYEPVEHFGGEATFNKNVIRDLVKADKCKENGVRLLYWKYDVPIEIGELKKLMES